MAIKTFTAGSVLTASDTNTYLANAGLVYVTTATMSGSTVSINNCFSSKYDNYRIMVTLYASTNQLLYMRMRSGGVDYTTPGYAWGRWYWGAATGNGYVYGDSGMAVGESTTMMNSFYFDCYSPYLSTFTHIMGQSNQQSTTDFFSIAHGGNLTTSASYDGFTIYPSAGTFNGTITVFGYRKA